MNFLSAEAVSVARKIVESSKTIGIEAASKLLMGDHLNFFESIYVVILVREELYGEKYDWEKIDD